MRWSSVKKYWIGVICVAAITVAMIGSAVEADAASGGKNFIRIKSSSIGGSWYAGGSAWAKLISDNYPEFLSVNIAAPGLDNESLKRLFRNEAELVFLTGPGAYNAYKGVAPVWKEPMPLRGLFGIWPGVLNTVVSADSKFQVLQDLKGAKIATYVPGDVNGEQMLALLKHHGITEENTKIFKIMKADAARMFIDGAIDAVVYYYGYGHANLKEMSASRKIRFLPNDPVKVQAFMKENPFYYLADFGAEFGVPNAKQLIGPYHTACRADLPEDTAYKVTKVWFENLNWLGKVLPSNMPYQNVKEPGAGVPIPLHPGAIKYYKEKGLMK
jgi:hypothetical protein